MQNMYDVPELAYLFIQKYEQIFRAFGRNESNFSLKERKVMLSNFTLWQISYSKSDGPRRKKTCYETERSRKPT